MSASNYQRPGEMSLVEKVWQINWGLVLVVCLVASLGFALLYSAANGSVDPWASRQAARFAIGLVMMANL